MTHTNHHLRQIATHQIDIKRVAANRARNLAKEMSEADRQRALRFADELDAQADELERRLKDDDPAAGSAA